MRLAFKFLDTILIQGPRLQFGVYLVLMVHIDAWLNIIKYNIDHHTKAGYQFSPPVSIPNELSEGNFNL